MWIGDTLSKDHDRPDGESSIFSEALEKYLGHGLADIAIKDRVEVCTFSVIALVNRSTTW